MKQLSDFPAYQVAKQKLAEVKTQHRAAVSERDALLATIDGTRNGTATLAERAAAVLSGDGGIVADVGDLREQYSRACRQAALLQEVVRLARQRLEDARAEASRVICDEARPAFSKLVADELRAGYALLKAQDSRRTYWQAMNDAGVSMAHLPAVAALVKADLRDPTAMFWQRFDDAIELGYVSADAFKRPAQAPGGDNPMARPGLRLIAAGPDGVGLVEVIADGRTRPVAGQWYATPKAAPAWGDAA